MEYAFKEVVKSRNHAQKEIEEAYMKIEHHKECIQVLMDAIQKKEQLLSGYNAIIKHSEQLLSKELKDSISQDEGDNR